MNEIQSLLFQSNKLPGQAFIIDTTTVEFLLGAIRTGAVGVEAQVH